MWPLDARVSTPYSVSKDEVVPIFLGLDGGHDRKRADNISFLKGQRDYMSLDSVNCATSAMILLVKSLVSLSKVLFKDPLQTQGVMIVMVLT